MAVAGGHGSYRDLTAIVPGLVLKFTDVGIIETTNFQKLVGAAPFGFVFLAEVLGILQHEVLLKSNQIDCVRKEVPTIIILQNLAYSSQVMPQYLLPKFQDALARPGLIQRAEP